jgi:hypothetical protein
MTTNAADRPTAPGAYALLVELVADASVRLSVRAGMPIGRRRCPQMEA